MFVASEFQSIRRLCPSELDTLLKKLSIAKPDWIGDEYSIYEQLDDDITREICAAMKSSSVIDGYTNLLKLGGIPYDYSETDNELLDKIISNGGKILDAVRKDNDEYNLWHAKWSNASPEQEQVENLNVTAVNTEPFNPDVFISNRKKAKNKLANGNGFNKVMANLVSSISKARNYIDVCIKKAKSSNDLLKPKGNSSPVKNVNDYGQGIASRLRDGEERTTIKKSVERHEKKIPPEPNEPAFTVHEMEDTLDILIKVNNIVKKI